MLEVKSMAQLTRLMSKLQAVKGILSVARGGDVKMNTNQVS
jgi:hypothetical protein